MTQLDHERIQAFRTLGMEGVAQDYEAAILAKEGAQEAAEAAGRRIAELEASQGGSGISEADAQARVDAAVQPLLERLRQIDELA